MSSSNDNTRQLFARLKSDIQAKAAHLPTVNGGEMGILLAIQELKAACEELRRAVLQSKPQPVPLGDELPPFLGDSVTFLRGEVILQDNTRLMKDED